MPYTPPSCSAVNFTLLPIFIPVCSAVNFNIGGSDVGITVHESVINIYNDTWFFVEGYFINVDASYLNIYSEELQFQTLSEIGADPSVIPVLSDVNLLQILPDCITHPSVINIPSDTVNMRAGQINDLPFKLSTGGLIIPWGGNESVDEFTTLKWEDATKVDDFIHLDTGGNTYADHSAADGWSVIDFKDNVTIVPWDKLSFADHTVASSWHTLIITDKLRSISYGNKYEISNIFVIPYLEPGAKDVLKLMEFASASRQITYTISVPWGAPGAKDKHQLVPWGPLSYYPFCSTKYFPIQDGIVNFKLELQDPEMVGVCFQVSFDVEGYNTDPRCPYKHHHTGRRDPYISGIPIVHTYPPGLQETYRMMNIILVETAITHTPIEVTSINIKYDKQSWLWSFSLTIPKDGRGVNYLELIKPTAGVFIDIRININGWIWICRVESWHESRVFAKDSWTVQGRSPSMELGSPVNQKTSYIYDAEGTDMTAGGQIIQDVLDGTMLGIDNTGWTMNWDAYANTISGFDPVSAAEDNWGIKPGTFSWVDKTQIEVVKMLTDAIGAFIITKPNCITDAPTEGSKTLYAVPITDVPPWHWNTNSIYEPDVDHAIRTAYATEVGRSFESIPVYNAVYVMGQSVADPQGTNINTGIPVAEIYREGVGPGERIYAPDVTDQWLTTWKACGERGRVVISDTGDWIKHSVRLFSLETKGNPSPMITGLVLPGDYVEIEEHGTNVWYGSVVATDISAAVINKSAFAVSQTIEVIQYIGD